MRVQIWDVDESAVIKDSGFAVAKIAGSAVAMNHLLPHYTHLKGWNCSPVYEIPRCGDIKHIGDDVYFFGINGSLLLQVKYVGFSHIITF